QHAGLHQGDHRHLRSGGGLSSAAYAGGEGPRSRPDEFLRAIRLDRALSPNENGRAGEGMEAIARRARQARRPLRVHSVRLLLSWLSQLLVEFGPLSGAGGAAASLSLAGRQS